MATVYLAEDIEHERKKMFTNLLTQPHNSLKGGYKNESNTIYHNNIDLNLALCLR